MKSYTFQGTRLIKAEQLVQMTIKAKNVTAAEQIFESAIYEWPYIKDKNISEAINLATDVMDVEGILNIVKVP
jgi:hypothetical protein